jgi:RNA polymerase sigma factor (TIGR02999 family)
MEPVGELTKLLNASAGGDREAFDQLFPMVYSALRGVAHQRLQNERPGHTLSTTALVHEAYLKLVDLDRIQYKGRAHFFAVAAQAMRNILVSYAHRRKALKRGGDQAKLPLDDVVVMSEARAEEVLALDEALERLKAVDARRHQVVECRFFGGMSIEETATALGISPATVKRDWNLARAWLNRELRGDVLGE